MLDLRAVRETITMRVPVQKDAADEIRSIAEAMRMNPKDVAAIVLERIASKPGMVSELLQEHLVQQTLTTDAKNER
jgi:4-aminobutyrate aminotransferase-like enzyme